MKVLLVGSGAREHALVWKLAAERGVSELICAPGNAGIRRLARCLPVAADDLDGLAKLADHEQVDFTVVGPEAPLGLGLVDRFQAAKRPILGPTAAAAALETSKVFAKDFMVRHGVPTARHRVCRDPAEAARALDEFGVPVVVKADGLAAGKGVVVAADRETADAAVRGALVERRFGDAGARVVVEECLAGREASFFVVTDGVHALTLPTAEDHKRALDGDRGPNTGGMGAFAPSPSVPPELHDRVLADIVRPTLEGMREEGRPFRGFLYVGLMLTADGPRVVEFNVRLGDPEAQVVLPMIDEDLLPLLLGGAVGDLPDRGVRTTLEPHVGVVLASGGYPGTHRTGLPVDGLDAADRLPEVMVFHAGTGLKDHRVVTAGGRVLTVVGRGRDYRAAIARAYEGAAQIVFEDMHYRRDIGARAVS